MKTRLLLAVLAAGLAAAQQPTPLLGTADPLACFTLTEGAVEVSTVDVTGQPFTRALRIKTNATAANPWNSRVRCFDTLAAQQNDTILITFWMRTLSAASGNGFAMLVVEQGGDPWAKSVEWSVGAKSEWKKVEVPFSMLQDFVRGSLASGANTYNISFWVNAVQEIEIGGITAQNYGLAYPFASLGLTNWPYEGHSPDAPWRAAAAERIDRIRKADVVVVARDSQGNPLADAAVHVKMKKHAFRFGTAVNATLLMSNNAQQPTYAQHLLQMFNYVVLENELKWPMWEGNRNTALNAVAWLRNNGITAIRGHNLIWPGRSNLPADVAAMLNPPVNTEALRTRIHDHFTDIMNATRGTLVDWDVLNEPVTNRDVMDALGNEEMATWFQWARAIDPNVKLYTNDYGIVTNGGYDPHQDQFYNVIQYILDHGGPVDGIGLQSHFGGALTPPERVLEILDRFAGFGKDLQVTEFDINTTDEQVQADYTRDFLTAVFSHPAIKGFLMWGFWEGAHWLPNGALLRLDWSAKPNYDVWMDLTQHQWWTDVEGRTDANGVFRTRGFLGDYDIEVAGQTVAATVVAGETPNYVFAGAHGAPDFAADGVVNAASLLPGPVAPGEIVEFRGTGFGWPETAAGLPSAGQLPVFSGDLRVLFDGAAAPMLYSLTGRAAAIVPYGVSGTTSAQIEYLGARSPGVTLPVVPAAPGVFCGFGSCALNLGAGGEAETNSAAHPAARGARVALFLTGDGLMSPAASDGQLPSASGGPRPVLPVVVRIGGVESTCPDNWTGLVYAGVTEVIACVPEAAPSGAVGLEVMVGGAAAQSGMTLVVR